MMNSYQHLTCRQEDHIAVVTMNSTPVNALTFTLLDELEGVFADLEKDAEVWAVVLCSALKVFAAGADVKNLASVRRFGNMETSRRFQSVLLRIAQFPHPVVCCVNGIAFGGGLELALSCDLRVFDGRAKAAFPEAGLGIIPGAGGTQRLTRLIGPGAARRLIYTGETVGAAEAYRLGLCEYLTGPGEGLPKAMEVAATICAQAPIAVAADKRCIDYAMEHLLADGLEYERTVGSDIFETEDKDEGATAFLEKRPPVFHNR